VWQFIGLSQLFSHGRTLQESGFSFALNRSTQGAGRCRDINALPDQPAPVKARASRARLRRLDGLDRHRLARRFDCHALKAQRERWRSSQVTPCCRSSRTSRTGQVKIGRSSAMAHRALTTACLLTILLPVAAGLPVRSDGIFAIDMTHINQKLAMRGSRPHPRGHRAGCPALPSSGDRLCDLDSFPQGGPGFLERITGSGAVIAVDNYLIFS
jgi:hypothetical protein